MCVLNNLEISVSDTLYSIVYSILCFVCVCVVLALLTPKSILNPSNPPIPYIQN